MYGANDNTKEKLYIRGGRRLVGEVAVSGGKNAALAIVPAALMAKEPCTIENLPDIEDIHVVIELMRSIGATVEFSNNVMHVDGSTITSHILPEEFAKKMRASYYFAPVLLGLCGCARIPLPGGCDIGARPIDQTIKGMSALGARVIDQYVELHLARGEMRGTEVFLDMPSVGATINTMLTAVNCEGTTTIVNCAKEPHIVDLANFLNSMGARVRGAGTGTIRIAGGRPLHGSNYAIIPDQIETGTLMIAAAATRGDVVISGAIPTHMESLSAKLLEMGVYVGEDDDRIHIRSDGELRPVNIKTAVYPGFPTDLQQPMAALLTTSKGSSTVTETIFEARFRYVDELKHMGANIRVFDRTAIIDGVPKLTGSRVAASDLRAGAALVVAGLMAEGNTEISGVNYILRGYEKLDEKLRGIGADVELRHIL